MKIIDSLLLGVLCLSILPVEVQARNKDCDDFNYQNEAQNHPRANPSERDVLDAVSIDSCSCFCCAISLVRSRSLSAMTSPLYTRSPSLTLRSSGSVMLTVMFKRLGMVVWVSWLVAQLGKG